ncbi:hypothetical protein J6590_102487, partial [Homalodisca vitripennis]
MDQTTAVNDTAVLSATSNFVETHPPWESQVSLAGFNNDSISPSTAHIPRGLLDSIALIKEGGAALEHRKVEIEFHSFASNELGLDG